MARAVSEPRPLAGRAPAERWRLLDWSSPAVVVALILGYLGVHFALRLAIGPTLGIDDAEQTLSAQQWAWGYRFRQPPLFTWLLLPAFEVFGVGVLALSAVRYLLLGLTYVLMYLVALRWVGDRRLAALAVFSFALIYVFAYYAHHDLTHTTALGALIALTFYAFARLAERPSLANYALLGLACGLGMLAKWNFVMLPAGLAVTCLLWPGFRQLVLSWKALLAGAITALIVAPTALWVLAHGRTVASVSQDILAGQDGGGLLGTLLEGTAALAKSALLFPMPFLVLFLLLFGPAVWRAVRAESVEAGSEHPRVTPEFIITFMGITLALHWLLVPAVGAVAFTERWMHPALMILPVALFALAARGRPSPRAIRAWLAVVCVFVVIAGGARLVRFGFGAEYCGKCRELVPFSTLAQGLRAAGFERGTIVVPPEEFHIGGNLRAAFPDSRVIDPGFPLEVFPDPTGQGQCLVAWNAGDQEAGRQIVAMEAFMQQRLNVPPEAMARSGEITAPLSGSRTRHYTLGYKLYPEGPGACR